LAAIDTNSPCCALVTGAVGGLGCEVSRQLLGRGCAVVICDIDAQGLAGTEQLLLTQGREVECIVCDLTDEGAPQAAEERARTRQAKPRAIVLRTLPGRGVRRIETSEKSYFFRVNSDQWDDIISEFEYSLEVAA